MRKENQIEAAPRKLNIECTDEMVTNYLQSKGVYGDDWHEFMASQKLKKVLEQHGHILWQNSKGRWVTYIPDEEKPKKRKQLSASTKEALEQKLSDFYESKDEDETASTMTLRKLYPEWLEDKKADEYIKNQTVKRNQTDWLRYYDEDPIVDVPLYKLTTNKLEVWTKAKIKSEHMGRHKFGNFSSIVRQMFVFATEKKGYLKVNPYARVKIDWTKGLCKEQTKPKKKLVFMLHEQQPFIDYCWEQYRIGRHTTQVFTPLAIIFLFYTGLREGELAALKFSDIFNHKITVQRMCEYKERKVVEDTKNHLVREVPLPPKAMEVIEEVRRKKLEMGLPVDGYIFTVNEPINLYTRVQAVIREYCYELKMVERSPHDIRRTYISNLLDAGVDLKKVMEYAGHNQSSTTLQYYAYAVKMAEELAEQVANALPY